MNNVRALVACAIAACALVAVLVIEIALPVIQPDAQPKAPRAGIALPPSNAAAQVEKPDDELVATILARPLFTPTRRPSSTAAPSVATATSLPRLTGTVISPAGRSALFAPAEVAAHPLILHEGDPIGPLVIRVIAPGLVDATGAGGRVRMRVSSAPTPVLEAQEPPPETPRKPPTAHSQGVEDGRQE